eukprot:4222609-Alexandrium_andersonii.AAC.1
MARALDRERHRHPMQRKRALVDGGPAGESTAPQPRPSTAAPNSLRPTGPLTSPRPSWHPASPPCSPARPTAASLPVV